ncbi:MAG: hypothetical protein UW68_C0005G0007 [Candidatus Collierbacteria bacterium GW2011_GWB1_44_6]|nr:MAG: hypothetical protein UW68_C0005G0007 [Candidatus Collierbacteria bacterium GW2011_GWB1_44_6]
MKYVKFLILLSFFLVPIFAWKLPGLLVGVGLYFLTVLNKNRKIPSDVALFPVAIASSLALQNVIVSVFAVSGFLAWVVPISYLLIIFIISRKTKAP